MFDWFDKAPPEGFGPDRYPLYRQDPHKSAHLTLNQLLVGALPEAEASLEEQPEAEQAEILLAIVVRLVWLGRYAAVYRHHTDRMRALARRLLRRRPALSAEGWGEALRTAAQADAITGPLLPLRALLHQLERLAEDGDLERPVMRGLELLLGSSALNLEHSEGRQLAMRVERLLGRTPAHPGGLDSADPWATQILLDLEQMEPARRHLWQQLWDQGSLPGHARPTQRWLRSCQEHLEELGTEAFTTSALAWLRQASQHLRRGAGPDPKAWRVPWGEHNEERLKELIWACGEVEDKALAASVGELAELCFRKAAQAGPRAPRLGHACLESLGRLGLPLGLEHLTRLKVQVRYPSAQKLIDKELEALAERHQLSEQDREELSLSDHGLDASGSLQIKVGAWRAEVDVTDRWSVDLRWRRADGQLQKSAPAQLKRYHDQALEAVTAQVRDLQAALQSEKERLERLLRGRRSWPLERWRQLYLTHHLRRPLAQGVIWQFIHQGQIQTGIWHQGQLVNVCDRPLHLPAQTQVMLWHPAEGPPTEALMWRTWLQAQQREQPFKQAHREVYRLQEDEEKTRLYSNRLAGSFLKQHQLAALCQQRGWRYHLQGVFFDQGDIPTLELPEWDLQAQLHVEPVMDQALVADSRICLFVTSGPVRFLRQTPTPEAAPLPELPPRVFSEVMRDVDLFVGITSQGQDPTWFDHALPDAQSWPVAFGPLDEESEHRRQLLLRLAPQLGIADRLSLEERFLVVRGHWHTYRIHLGSSHVLLEDDQLLPLVPDRKAALRREKERPALDFAQDRTLGLILSKAQLLAHDLQIRDRALRLRLQPQADAPQSAAPL